LAKTALCREDEIPGNSLCGALVNVIAYKGDHVAAREDDLG
jgi:hypothetical protein